MEFDICTRIKALFLWGPQCLQLSGSGSKLKSFVSRHLQAPWYNSYVAHQGEVNDMRDDLESILYQFGVDIVFAGKLALQMQDISSTHSQVVQVKI